MRECLSYDDILLEPRYSAITSRKDIDLSVNLGNGLELAFPLIASPMDTISEKYMAFAMANYGATAIIHRYNSIPEQADIIKEVRGVVGAAVGVTDDFIERAVATLNAGAAFVCVDVAHGHHALVKRGLTMLRKTLGDGIHIMAGNVATLEAINALADWGADSVRVGIGGGAICSTRVQTGHGIPTLQSVMDCARTDRQVTLIADGGIKTSGDIVKSLAAGADAVMCGSLIAGTDETPGDVFENADGTRWKIYRGMASKESQVKWKGKYSSFEGVSSRVPYRGPVIPILQDLERGIRSGLSYSGVGSIPELQYGAKFLRQTSAGIYESSTHIKTRKW